MNFLLIIGIIIIVGFFGGLAVRKLKIPRITGYIIIGILLSASLLNVISKEVVGSLSLVTDIALGIIAYLIGGNLHVESLKRLKKNITSITLFQSLGAWFLVTLVLTLLGPLFIPNASFYQLYFPMAFIIGAVSCATAPAATIAVVNEYKATGPLTTTLLAVVALDDAIAVLAFAIALGICRPLVSGVGSVSFYQTLIIPLLHILASVAIGIIFAIALIYMVKLTTTRGLLLVVVLGTIMLCTGLTNYLGLSLILANMVMGFILVNTIRRKDVFSVVDEIEDVIFVMFFVLAGLHFDLNVIKVAGILALLIILSRCFAKYTGARIGASISGAPESVRKYLGLALLPKAGVTIGLVLLAARSFPSFGAIMVNAVLASTIINELVAPPLTKYAIFKAKESTI